MKVLVDIVARPTRDSAGNANLQELLPNERSTVINELSCRLAHKLAVTSLKYVAVKETGLHPRSHPSPRPHGDG